MIYLLAPGPLKYSFIKEGLEYYLNKLSKWTKVVFQFPKIKGSYSKKEERLRAEEEVLLKYIQENTYLILLDERGKSYHTLEFAKFFERLLATKNNITFLVGGPEGVSENLKKRASELLKISDFTLNHEVALLVLAEALYRTITLIKGHPYHRE